MSARPRGDPRLLRHLVQRLRGLAEQAPTPDARAEVEHHLGSKWQGVRSVAAHTMGRWGDSESVATLRALMERATPAGIRNTAAWALRQCVTARDAPWVLEGYFAATDDFEAGDYFMLVLTLPPDAVRPRLLEACDSPRRDDGRKAFMTILNVPFPDRAALLARLAKHADERVRRRAA
jgi:HEAT repeat protein